jgi:hypothetical protein
VTGVELDVSLGVPLSGWAPFTIAHSKVGTFESAASDILNDFLGELATALVIVLAGGTSETVHAWLEPADCQFRFLRLPSGEYGFRLLVLHPAAQSGRTTCREVAQAVGPAAAICMPFLAAFQALREAAGDAFWPGNGWRHRFPSDALAEAERLARRSHRPA